MRQFAVLFFLLSSIKIFSQERYTIDTIQLESAIIKETRTILLYKSLNLSRTDSVTFLYLIDGEYSSYRYQQLKERFKDSISNIIAVGIVNTDRRRDLLFAKDKFLGFITSELIPAIEKDYISENRILFGHSFGGGFTIYAMLNNPHSFNSYIASSPTPIMNLINKEDYLQMDQLCNHKIRFYFSVGANDMKQVRKWSQSLKENLTTQTFNNFDWRFIIFKDRDHNNSDIPALINGYHYLKTKS